MLNRVLCIIFVALNFYYEGTLRLSGTVLVNSQTLHCMEVQVFKVTDYPNAEPSSMANMLRENAFKLRRLVVQIPGGLSVARLLADSGADQPSMTIVNLACVREGCGKGKLTRLA